MKEYRIRKIKDILLMFGIMLVIPGLDEISVYADEVVIKYDVESDITNHAFIVADIDCPENYEVEGYINGQKASDDKIQAGSYKITLAEGDNTIEFDVTDKEGNVHQYVKNIYMDNDPPVLAVSKDIDNLITSKDYVYISGYSEAGAKLTLNGENINMKAGYFNEKAELDFGKNILELVAEDMAGNRTIYKAEVIYEWGTSTRRELYIITFTLILLTIAYIITFKRGIKRKEKEKEERVCQEQNDI